MNEISTSEKIVNHLPLYVQGEVIHGFGRGSKQLGIPTANFPPKVVNSLAADLPTGVYCGWAQVANEPLVHKMVLCLGWNPFFKNLQKSMETHILHEFNADFYGSDLKVIVVEYLRSERNFPTVDDLIVAIRQDIEEAERCMDKLQYQHLKTCSFFTSSDPSVLN